MENHGERTKMRKIIIMSAFFTVLMAMNLSSQAAEEAAGPIEKFVGKHIDQLETACRTELDTYCKTVTPGEGRKVACIFAHNDKLSRPCENALYDSADEFRNASQNLSDFAAACQTDIEKFCPAVQAGGGRILACLEKNKTQISGTCNGMLSKSKAVDLGAAQTMN